MNTGTLNSLDTIIRTNDTGQARLTRFLESPEIKMFIHDLRHLVQAIVGSVDTLQMALQEHAADLAAKSLDRLRQNTDLAVDMLGHFGANPPINDEESTECDVAWEIERIVDSLAPLLRQNGITVHQKALSPTIAAIHKTDLKRLLLNLLLNAIEATNRPDAPVTITAGAASDESVQVTVQDNGYGIDKDKLANIFDDGYTTKARRGNKGLGLVIVKQLLETYHGTMRVQSCPGRGTRFMVRLPRPKKRSAEATISNPVI
jgi:signal transduction histidine kinase